VTHAKPCACNRAGCHVVRLDGEKLSRFASRQYGTDTCRREAQAAYANSSMGRTKPLDNEKPRDLAGALVTPVEWLDLPPVRLRLAMQMEGRR
jgi:hypothetical protein